ncbi:MAG TPA: hypothetical protein VFM83_03680 [Gaiellaceae bacterium]|nr:hypothetical protein [Gaiellaceae bacterium]
MRARRVDDSARDGPDIDPLAREDQLAGLDLARQQDVVDDVREPLGLVGDHRQETAA